MEPHKIFQIAIDGPVGSGKSDISSRLAKKLGLTYLYTGAMYRALGWAARKQGIDLHDEQRVYSLLKQIVIDLRPPAPDDVRGFSVWVDNKNITNELFTSEMSQGASDVAVHPLVRKFMVTLQQKMAQGKSVVMEGRDIALRVLPNAQLKIYLNASLEERAKRRLAQYKEKDPTKTLEHEIADTKIRDDQDMHRAADPLQKLPDAWELDTTGMTQDQVVDAIVAELRKRGLV